ncbi:hypothetical protein Bpfe_029755, partial [Biomphalaria pfeifferi]
SKSLAKQASSQKHLTAAQSLARQALSQTVGRRSKADGKTTAFDVASLFIQCLDFGPWSWP